MVDNHGRSWACAVVLALALTVSSCKDEKTYPTIHAALQAGDIDAVRRLLAERPDLIEERAPTSRQTPLISPCSPVPKRISQPGPWSGRTTGIRSLCAGLPPGGSAIASSRSP